MKKKILVVANGEPPSRPLLLRLMQEHDQLVAVDGGLHCCLDAGFEPELLIGDFDSISEEERENFSHITQIHTPDQNRSDLEKALNYLFTSDVEGITVCGALGKRLDHTLTNICLLSRYPDKVKFETDTEICFALPKTSVLKCRVGQILSLIPVSTYATEIFTQGLKWELAGESLSKNYVGISNVCLKNEISIRFDSGDLIVCLLQPEQANDEGKAIKTR
jgi:thiamine pyrophosphokinase